MRRTVWKQILKNTAVSGVGLILCAGMPCVAAETAPQSAGYRITEVQDQGTGMTVARCYAPSDYTVNGETIWCGKWQSAGFPAQVYLTALSPDENTVLGFYSQVGYEHYLDGSISGETCKQHQDGVFDTAYMTPMLQFMTADTYCDYLAQTILSNQQLRFVKQEEITPELQNTLDTGANELYTQAGQLTAGTGINVDDVYLGLAERVYSVTLNGSSFWLNVSTAVQAVQMSGYMDFGYGVTMNESYISWEVPCTFFMLTPESEYDGNYSCYEQFVLNTAVSDQFTAALVRTRDQIIQSMTQSGAASMSDASDYCRRSVSASAGPDTSYSDERFTDYIFSQNDYTLSNGDHVKVPTSYDYVYADDNGNVYVTNSTDQPAGTTQLYPN